MENHVVTQECGHCHLCSAAELKARKKAGHRTRLTGPQWPSSRVEMRRVGRAGWESEMRRRAFSRDSQARLGSETRFGGPGVGARWCQGGPTTGHLRVQHPA